MKELKKLLEKAEELGWSYDIIEEDDRRYVELGKYSPSGEDFHMDIDIGKEIPETNFMDNLANYGFDPDEHAEMYIKVRGKNGVPSSVRELIEDAEAIEGMINELYDKCWKIYADIPEEKISKEVRCVYVCSPLRGDLIGNMEKAREYCRDIVKKYPGTIPFAPHIYCTQFLNDDIPEEREMGIHIGNKILQSWCDELWVFGVRSIQDASAGMREEIAIARENSIPVKMGEDMLKR